METQRLQTTTNKKRKKQFAGQNQLYRELERRGIKYKKEVKHPKLNKLRYDVVFMYADKLYFCEFDGKQHFKVGKYNRSEYELENQRQRDKIKTWIPIVEGYRVIRISYKERREIGKHIDIAIESAQRIYVSNKELYKDIREKPALIYLDTYLQEGSGIDIYKYDISEDLKNIFCIRENNNANEDILSCSPRGK